MFVLFRVDSWLNVFRALCHADVLRFSSHYDVFLLAKQSKRMVIVNKSMAEAEAGAQSDVAAHSIPPFALQPDVGHETADRYQLDELLRYHDRAFVAHTYAALCRRAPTAAEFARTLDDLRAGRRSKSEIIESLCAGQTAVQVVGLPSPMLRRMSRWPLVGYVLRLLRGLARLPVLVQHQQQFESYALAQQQRITDYLNETLAPAIAQQTAPAPAVDAALTAIIADAAESVLMLSDALIELSARHAATQTQLEELQAQQHDAQTRLEEFQAQQREVQTQLEKHQAQHHEVQTQLEEFQAQQREVQTRLHADLSALTAALTAEQQAAVTARHRQAEATAAQREFLVQEQRVIVETQRATLAELQAQLRELAAQQTQQRAELAAQVRQLQALIAAATGVHTPTQAAEQAPAAERGQA